MNIKEFFKSELSGWGKYERIIFPLELLLIICISIYLNDSRIALVSAVCGISYTILAGKGKISCYLFGLAGTMCYAYIAYKNNLYGNVCLYALYYFPMQILGIFKWKKHLKKDTREIIKTKLPAKEFYYYITAAVTISILLGFILKYNGDTTPFIDSVTTVFSIAGLIFTIKRCIEQWYIWTLVNGLSVIMWIKAYILGSNCFATILMWLTYFVLGLYFLYTWRKDLKITNTTLSNV